MISDSPKDPPAGVFSRARSRRALGQKSPTGHAARSLWPNPNVRSGISGRCPGFQGPPNPDLKRPGRLLLNSVWVCACEPAVQLFQALPESKSKLMCWYRLLKCYSMFSLRPTGSAFQSAVCDALNMSRPHQKHSLGMFIAALKCNSKQSLKCRNVYLMVTCVIFVSLAPPNRIGKIMAVSPKPHALENAHNFNRSVTVY